MQIVINVDNELYEYFSKRRTMHDNGYFSHVGKLIKTLRDGTQLPKGHGRLIDESQINETMEREFKERKGLSYIDLLDIIHFTPTILEHENL